MTETAALDELLDPFALCLDARRVAEFRTSPSVQLRVDELAERANEGLLSEAERTEYAALIDASDFISILKLKARRL